MSKYWGVKLSWLNENMSIVNWVQKSSTSTLCVVAERRGSHHLIWWKNHTKTDHYDFFYFPIFFDDKRLLKKKFHAKYRHHITRFMIIWHWHLRPSLMIKRRKKSMQKNMHFLATIPKNSFGFLVVMVRYALKIAQNLTSWFRPSVQKRNDAVLSYI